MNLSIISICFASEVTGAMPSKSESLGALSSLGMCGMLKAAGAVSALLFRVDNADCCAAPQQASVKRRASLAIAAILARARTSFPPSVPDQIRPQPLRLKEI